MSELKTMRYRVRYEGMTINQCLQEDPEYVKEHYYDLVAAHKAFMREFHPKTKSNYFISLDFLGWYYASYYAEKLARKLVPCAENEDCFYEAFLPMSLLENPLRNYDGQPVIIWDCFTAEAFFDFFNGSSADFKGNFLPVPFEYTMRYGLVNTHNIVISPKSYDDFIAEIIKDPQNGKRGSAITAEDAEAMFPNENRLTLDDILKYPKPYMISQMNEADKKKTKPKDSEEKVENGVTPVEQSSDDKKIVKKVYHHGTGRKPIYEKNPKLRQLNKKNPNKYYFQRVLIYNMEDGTSKRVSICSPESEGIEAFNKKFDEIVGNIPEYKTVPYISNPPIVKNVDRRNKKVYEYENYYGYIPLPKASDGRHKYKAVQSSVAKGVEAFNEKYKAAYLAIYPDFN